jgi:hypothetical protein
MTGVETPVPAVLERWTVTSGSNVNSRAAVVIRAGDRDWHASAEGNGAMDALYKAVDLALAEVLGGHPLLLAYDVHALAEGPGAEGRVTVRIAPPLSAEGARGDGRFDGVVTSPNTVAASVEAYLAAINAMLASASWAGAAEAAGSAAEPGAAGTESAAGQARAVFDDDARPIDTTEWFNR